MRRSSSRRRRRRKEEEEEEEGKGEEIRTLAQRAPIPPGNLWILLRESNVQGTSRTAPSRRKVTAPVHYWPGPLSEVLGPGGTALDK